MESGNRQQVHQSRLGESILHGSIDSTPAAHDECVDQRRACTIENLACAAQLVPQPTQQAGLAPHATNFSDQ
jgi:hypothetical protein